MTYPINSLDCFVVSAGDLDILDYGEGKLAGVLFVGFLDLLGSCFVADGGSHVVASCKEGIDDFCGNIA